MKIITHFDVNLVELHEGDRLPGASPSPITKHHLYNLCHIPLPVRINVQPALRAEEIRVCSVDFLGSLKPKNGNPDAGTAWYKLPVNCVSFGWDFLHCSSESVSTIFVIVMIPGH